MKKLFIGVAIAVLLLFSVVPAMADTSQDVTVTATPTYISIANTPTSYDFGVVAASSTPATTSGYFSIDSTSTVITNIAIAVTTTSWSGGVGWTHSDTATAGADTAGLQAGTGGTNDIIVKNASPNNLVSSLAADTDYSWNLQLIAPTSFSDGAEKTIIVRLTATAA